VSLAITFQPVLADIIVTFSALANNIVTDKATQLTDRLSSREQSATYYQTKRNANPSTATKNIFGSKKGEFLAAAAL